MLRKILWAGVGTCALLFGANKWGYDYLVMPCLLKMDPERAHRVAVGACRLGLVPQTFQKDPEELVRIATHATALMLSLHSATTRVLHMHSYSIIDVHASLAICIRVSGVFSIRKFGDYSLPTRLAYQLASINTRRQ